MAKEAIEITPTLVVGLGGTGMRVLSLFKEKILGLCGTDAPVAFLGIDTDKERLPGAALNDNEFVLCDCILAPDVVANIDMYPDIKRWWLPNVDPGQIIRGAQMKRCVGRLACYVNFSSKIRPALVRRITSLKRLTNPEALTDAGFRVRRTIRVYVVGSMSGGTGGGFFYDTAVAVRHTIREEAGVNLPTSVAGIVVLPRAFRMHVPMDWQQEKVRANFYAGLREIEYLHRNYMSLNDKESDLYMSLGGTPMMLNRAPFDWIYLIDTLNEQGQNISMQQLWSMIASNLCLEVYSSLTNEVEQSVFANIPMTTPYGSFATASLRVPVGEILEYCALRCAKEVLENRVAAARPANTEIDEKARFLNSVDLFQAGSEALAGSLVTVAQDRKFRISVAEDLQHQSADEAVMVANEEWETLQSLRNGLPAARDAICEAAAKKQEEVEAALNERMDTLVDKSGNAYGLEFLIHFTRRLSKECKVTADTLEEKAAAIDIEQNELLTKQAMEELRQTAQQRGSWIVQWFDQGKSMQRCYASWSWAVNGYAQSFLAKTSLVEAARVFRRLEERVDRLKTSLKQIADQIDREADHCDKMAESVAASLDGGVDEHVLVTNVIGKGSMEGLYQTLSDKLDLKDVITIVKNRITRTQGWAHARLNELPDVVQKELLPAIRTQLRPRVRALDLFTAAEKYWSGSVKKWIRSAVDQCSPFCNWNRAVVPSNVLHWICIGVEDANRQADKLGTFDRARVKLASTGDRHEIVIHALTAGYPASAVTGLGEGQDDRFHYVRYCQKLKEAIESTDADEFRKQQDFHVHVDKRWLNPDGTPRIPDIK